jgi:hypothetical protein
MCTEKEAKTHTIILAMPEESSIDPCGFKRSFSHIFFSSEEMFLV